MSNYRICMKRFLATNKIIFQISFLDNLCKITQKKLLRKRNQGIFAYSK